MRKLIAVLLLALALTQVSVFSASIPSAWADGGSGSVTINGGGWPGGK